MLRRSLILIVLLLLLSFPLYYWYGVNQDHVRVFAELDDPDLEAVEIPQGASVRGIANILLSEDIITNGFLFRACAQFSGSAGGLRSGYYRFPDTTSIVDVLEILSAGSHQATRKITFPEGYTIKRMASVIESKCELSARDVIQLSNDKEFIASFGIKAPTLEGYLLPETYDFRYDASVRSMLSHMVLQLQASLSAADTMRMKKLGASPHRIITMASLVEGETNLDRERARVAGVYYNRLRRGMLLQADPTIQFIINDGPRRLLYRDLTINSPYNTYMHTGLPPGPVNNPGLASIKAAMYPESHDWLYFVADGKGGHTFSRTFEEHGRAVSQYRRIQRSRRK